MSFREYRHDIFYLIIRCLGVIQNHVGYGVRLKVPAILWYNQETSLAHELFTRTWIPFFDGASIHSESDFDVPHVGTPAFVAINCCTCHLLMLMLSPQPAAVSGSNSIAGIQPLLIWVIAAPNR